MGNALKVIDLYSGVGGLSLSAEKAGFKVAAAVEREKRVIDCHEKNFPNSIHICADVSSLTGKELLTQAKFKRNSDLLGIIGGPPCQGFSAIGKRNIDDERNELFQHFFKLIAEARPAFFLAENVPGILHSQYYELRKAAINLVEPFYDVFEPLVVTANEFGAATSRTRIFFMGIRSDIIGSRQLMDEIILQKIKNQTTVREALEGLPEDVSDEWLDFNSSWRIVDNPKKRGYVAQINQLVDGLGQVESLNRFNKKGEVSGCFGTRHSREIMQRYAALLPGQQDKISKSQRLDLEGLCPTLRAGTDNTKGSYQAVRPIHPTLPRVITPREAARLQGFPDWFQFHETKWHSFRQIGNSVCPIAATKILSAIKTTLSM